MNRSQKRTPQYRSSYQSNGSYENPHDQPEEWDCHLPLPELSYTLAAFLVAVLGFLCYFSSWDGEFVFDDSEAILNNKDVKLDKPWENLFFHDFWGNKLASNTSHKSYRPLTVITFR